MSFISRTSVIEFILIIPKSASLAPSVLYFITCQFYLSFRFNIYNQALLSSSSLKYDGQPCPVVRLTLEANTGHMPLSFFIHGIVIVRTHVINSKSSINWLFFYICNGILVDIRKKASPTVWFYLTTHSAHYPLKLVPYTPASPHPIRIARDRCSSTRRHQYLANLRRHISVKCFVEFSYCE